MSDNETELDNEETPLSVLGDYAVELADRLTAEHPDGCKLGDLVIVYEVIAPDGKATVSAFSSEPRDYVVDAILREAIVMLRNAETLEALADEEDD